MREPTGRHRVPPPPEPDEQPFEPLLRRVADEQRRLQSAIGDIEKRMEEERQARSRRVWTLGLALFATALLPTITAIYTTGQIVERLDTTAAEVRALRDTSSRHDQDIAALRARLEMLWDERGRLRP